MTKMINLPIPLSSEADKDFRFVFVDAQSGKVTEEETNQAQGPGHDRQGPGHEQGCQPRPRWKSKPWAWP